MPGPVQTNGMSAAAAALQMLERRQQVIANNLANATTKGFKAETPFARMMGNALATTDTALDLGQGTLTETHNALDLGIQGDGFFVVRTPSGERWARNGSFQLDGGRRLVDDKGNPVLAEGGEVTLPPGLVEIDKTGLIKVNGKPFQRLRIESAADTAELQHEGGTLFVPPTAGRTPVPVDARTVRQGFLEESNVNPMTAMTDMLAVLHRYQAAQRILTTIDGARGMAVNDLAKPV